MTYAITLIIEDGRESNLNVTACSTNSASIFITADNMLEAKRLLQEGEAVAQDAMENWQPEAPAPKKEQPEGEHYIVCPRSIERMARDKEEFEATSKGQRFIHALETARDFTQKHHYHSISVSQAVYLANKHEGSLINGLGDIEALSYRRGYRQGYADAKKKRSN